MFTTPTLAELENSSEFIARHIGIDEADETLMLRAVGSASRRELIDGIRRVAQGRRYLSPDIAEAVGHLTMNRRGEGNIAVENYW